LFVVAGFIGWTRLYLGVHWLADVIGGALVATAWMSVCLVVRANVRARARRSGKPSA
jgi:undecaprenyl-diphosphatase